ncbi:hypothetical protein M948_18240 [Virgibacillus sp. CM-4]|uniref:hypothetical protein n=1 Tax=Virgibacillus sp. CM-4 TaxID=1354277 RepID=UPI0003884B19|nr:hypothetical protein [Virgibacillus sp. CM-4]EQB35040.1 hypothetical protein M948_18240 [Virgibacillus sp. CM-4]
MNEQQLSDLRDELKDYLKITWPDEDDDLLKYIKDGIDYLYEITGTEIDYTVDSMARRLLMDYGRYVYNHSLELFEINFERVLFKLSLREGMKSFETENTETSSWSI